MIDNNSLVEFENAVKDITAGNRKFLTNEYLAKGIFPIIDQGDGLIGGYTNENEIVKRSKDVVVFGDHTKILKYVDFDFCLGADGVKVLQPIDKLDSKFLYYFLQTLQLPDVGYSRHYKYLKRNKIPLPPLSIQKEIANRLDLADELRKKTRAQLEKYDELSQAVFVEMFGDPVRNEKGWEKVNLESFGKINSGSTPSRNKNEYYNGEIPWVKTGEVNGSVILDTEEKISKEGLKNSSCQINPINSIIIAMYGQGITRGQVGILGINAATNQACAVIHPSPKINHDFLLNLLKINYNDLRSLGRGGNQPNLNLGLIKNYKIILPPLTLQTAFAEKIKNIEAQKALLKKELEKAEELFEALLAGSFE